MTAPRVRIPGLRGRCGECLASVLVRADGKLRYHGPHNKPCKGTGGRPIALQMPGMRWTANPDGGGDG